MLSDLKNKLEERYIYIIVCISCHFWGKENKKIEALQSASVSKISILIQCTDALGTMVSDLNLQLSRHKKKCLGAEHFHCSFFHCSEMYSDFFL